MRGWIVWLLLLGACKKHKPKDHAPEPVKPSKSEAAWFDDIRDAPVAISGVTVKQTTLRGYDQALPISFTVTGKQPIADRTVLMLKASCRVSGQVIASAVPAPIELRQLEANTPQKLDAIPFGMYGFTGKAQPCEVSWFLDRQVPGVKPQRFQRSCWSGGSLAAGRCADLEPRPGVTPFTLSSAIARLDADKLLVDATIVVGPGRTGDESVALKTRCEIDGKIVEDAVAGLSNLGYLTAGEAFRTTGSVDATSPAWCELTVGIDGGPELGKRCVRDGKQTDGGC